MSRSGEVGSPKWISKQMKMKGLQKLKWYCQSCEKQCRDANGYRLHTQSPSHLAKLESFRQNSVKWSKEFESGFLKLLKTSFRGSVSVNKVYNEYIRDKAHIHLNATKWKSLTSFVNYLNECKLIKICQSEPEIIIEYIDVAKEQFKQREKLMEAEKASHKIQIQKTVLESQMEVVKENEEPFQLQEPQQSQEASQQQQPKSTKPGKISFSLKK